MVLGSLHSANHLFVQLPGPHVVLVVDVVARVGRVEVDDCIEKVPIPEGMTIQEIFHAAPSHFGNGNICPPHLAWFAPRNCCQPVAIVISGGSKGDSPNIPSVYLISALLPTGNPWYLKAPSLFRESGICPTSGSRFRTIPWLLGQG